MPVVGRGDDDGVDGRIGEQFAEVVVELRIVALRFLHLLAGGFAPLAEGIGDGDGGGSRHREEVPQQAGALAAHADVAEADGAAGSVRGGGAAGSQDEAARRARRWMLIGSDGGVVMGF